MADSQKDPEDFATQASKGANASLLREFFDFLKENKKWWLAPILITVLGLGLLVVLGGGAAAPFIYTLF